MATVMVDFCVEACLFAAFAVNTRRNNEKKKKQALEELQAAGRATAPGCRYI